ncbi:hypothetical protein L107_08863 [Cyanobium sp. Copco_Reservoir_LC18]|uniref:hypothetical protein n=1 Tax=Cyanobium sp. Copco_Reservoir_LC18 TaxID=1328305 RepID=UPI00135A1DD6|nr:hypothetical protein [Cyanobium sp. Copco_Reservoir_LC18]KAF0653689.1 hypothetical protein L107_08863 [Cyanobium sp. Copco_Reservoir_LC18]
MSIFGNASGSIWENWTRDHGQWLTESKDPGEFIVKLLWTPFGAASTACAAYVDEFERHPGGTLAKTAGIATSVVIPGAGLLGVAVDAAAVAGGQVLGGELNRQQDRDDVDQRVNAQTRASVRSNVAGRDELDALYN